MAQEYLPAGFTFTQTALRTYRACPCRFRLRYIDRVPWPTFPMDVSAEAAMEQGRRFHELARQHFLGLDVTRQVAEAGEDVAAWWAALQASPPDLTGYSHRYPEAGLSIPIGRYRLSARYDLLAVGDDAALIVDWKTGRTLPSAEDLSRDVQTRVYLYVLAEGGTAYHASRSLPTEALTLCYWHPRGPQQVCLLYSSEQRESDRTMLEGLVFEIATRSPEDMAAVNDDDACGRCAFTALCGRPVTADWAGDAEETFGDEMRDWPEL